MTTHEVAKSSAECGECGVLRRGNYTDHDAHRFHLQAQKDAWWLLGQTWCGDNPLVGVTDWYNWSDRDYDRVRDALRAQMEAKK